MASKGYIMGSQMSPKLLWILEGRGVPWRARDWTAEDRNGKTGTAAEGNGGQRRAEATSSAQQWAESFNESRYVVQGPVVEGMAGPSIGLGWTGWDWNATHRSARDGHVKPGTGLACIGKANTLGG